MKWAELHGLPENVHAWRRGGSSYLGCADFAGSGVFRASPMARQVSDAGSPADRMPTNFSSLSLDQNSVPIHGSSNCLQSGTVSLATSKLYTRAVLPAAILTCSSSGTPARIFRDWGNVDSVQLI